MLTATKWYQQPVAAVMEALVTADLRLFFARNLYVLPQAGFNPLRTAPFPAEWRPFIALLALPGLLIIELEEFLVDRFKKCTNG